MWVSSVKKFEFTLSALLKVRLKKEEIARNNLMDSHRILKRVSDDLEELLNEKQQIDQKISTIQKKLRNTNDLLKLFEYLEVMQKKIKRQEEIVKEARFAAEIKRKEAITAMQERKVIENIKEKKYKEWEKEFFDAERKAFDELSTIKFESKQRK